MAKTPERPDPAADQPDQQTEQPQPDAGTVTEQGSDERKGVDLQEAHEQNT